MISVRYLVIMLVSLMFALTACNPQPVENKKNEQKTQTSKQKIQIRGQIKFSNIDWINGSPRLQNKSGIYFFTQENHPQDLDKAFKYSSSNGWLIQLDPVKHAKYKRNRMKIVSIYRTDTPTLFKVIVQLTPGGDSTNATYCFFEASKKELPTHARLVVETQNGETLFN